MTLLTARTDAQGNPWARGLSDGSAVLNAGLISHWDEAAAGGTGIQSFAHYINRPVGDFQVDLTVVQPGNVFDGSPLAPTYWQAALRKEIATNSWVSGRWHPRGGYVDVRVLDAGTATLIASRAVASLGYCDLRLRVEGQSVSLGFMFGGSLVASVGAAHARAADTGYAGLAGVASFANASALGYGDWQAVAWDMRPVPSSPLGARDVYGIEAKGNRVFRRRSGGDLTGQLAGVKRGPTPDVPVASARLAVLQHGLPHGRADGLLGAEVRVRERFRFAR